VTDGERTNGEEVGGMSRRTLVFAMGRVVGWLIVPLYVAGDFAFYLLRRGAGLGNGSNLLDDVVGMVLSVGFGAFAVVGAILVARRPSNLIGWIMAAVALMVSIFNAGGAYATYVMITQGQPDALAVVGAWTANCYWFVMLALALFYLPMLFPDGRLPSRRWLPVAVLAGIAASGFVLPRAFMDTLPLNEAPGYEIDNPIGIEGLGTVENLPFFDVLLNCLLVIAFVGAAASVVVRFRRSRGVERLQMKWFVYVTVVFVGGSILASAIGVVTGVRWLEQFSFLLSMVALVSLPIAVGIAILKYRLYDIDVVINRTLVYGPLTAALLLIYFGGVVSLQYAFRALTGQESQIAVVASTLAIAALFNPLRKRVQAFVDRLFYRRKYDARKTLQDFSARLRDETDLDMLNDHLVGVIAETMKPAHVSLWMRPDPTFMSSVDEEARYLHK
jgi:hypothetical protein